MFGANDACPARPLLHLHRVHAPRVRQHATSSPTVRIPPHRRDRASLRRFEEGKASVYAFVAKDQLMSFRDLSFAACSARERGEVEASARSQREAAEAANAAAAGGRRQLVRGEQRRRPSALAGEDGIGHAVAAASSLADAQMDGHWRAVSLLVVHRIVGRHEPHLVVNKCSPTNVFGEALTVGLGGRSTSQNVSQFGARPPEVSAKSLGFGWSRNALILDRHDSLTSDVTREHHLN